jgi:VanZ family protein
MKFLQILTLIWAAAILTFSIVNPPTAGITGDTITLHFAAYAFLAALALSSTVGKRLKIFIAVVCYGMALEILQSFIGRTFSFADVSTNCIGALIATAIFCAINRQNS